MAKTQQELDDEERERQRRANAGSGFSFSDLWSWFPSLGTIIGGLILITGLYFIAKQDGVQNWIGETFGADAKKFVKDLVGNADGLIGKLASGLGFGDAVNDYAANMPIDEVQKKMRDEGLPDAAVTALAGNAEVWKGTVAIIKAGGGSVADPISDKNIFAFLTQPGGPERIKALTAGVKLTGPMDDKQKAFAQQLTAAIKPIIADERLDQLLTTHRGTVVSLLLQFSPVKVEMGTLGTVLDKVALGADGKATPQFRELLTSLTTITGDAAADATAQKAAVQKFVGELIASDRLDQLLTSDRATMLGLVQQFSPVKFDAQKLAPVLDKIALGTDGKVTPGFRELLTGLTSVSGDAAADKAAQFAAIKKFLGNPAINGAVIKQFAQSIDVASMADGEMKAYILQAQNATPATIEAARTLLTGPVPPATLQELGSLASDPKKAALKLMDRLMNDGGLRQQLMDGHALNPVGQLLQEKLRTTTDPQEKSALAFLTTRPANEPNRFVNMEAMFNLVDAIANNPHNIVQENGKPKPGGGINKGTNIVMHGLIGYVTATNDAERKAALNTLSPQAMNFFFSDPKNSAALGTFFKTMNNGTLPPEQRRMIATLRAHWGEVVLDKNGHLDTAKSHGLAEILADPKAVAYLLEQMRNPNPNTPKPTEDKLRSDLGWAKALGGTTIGSLFSIPDTGTIPQNAEDIIAIMKASGQLSLPTTTEKNAQSIMRSRGGLGIFG